MPTLGIAWKFAEFVFLKRNYEEDQKIIPKQISELVDHPDPIWVCIFETFISLYKISETIFTFN